MNYKDRILLMKKMQKELEAVEATDSNTYITISNNEADSNPVNNDMDEVFDVMTNEGFVNQLNRLFAKGSIDKEYYIQQVLMLKNTYSNTYSTIKEKLLMDVWIRTL